MNPLSAYRYQKTILVLTSSVFIALLDCNVPTAAAAAPLVEPNHTQPKDEPIQSALLPDEFRHVNHDVVPLGNATISLRDDAGTELRALRFYRVSELAKAPYIYVVVPVPQLEINHHPIPGLPEIVFNLDDSKTDLAGVRSFLLIARLMSDELLNLDECLNAVRDQDTQFLIENRVDPSKIKITHFPITHAFIELEIANEIVAVTKTRALTADPERVEFWLDLTPTQLQRISRAYESGILRMIWIFQYLGTGPVLKANAQATATAQMWTTATEDLSANQKSGKTPIFDRDQRERVAQKLLGELRISVKANNPDGLLLLNIDSLLPKLFEHWVVEGPELTRFMNDPVQNAALNRYLEPHLIRLQEEAAKQNVTVTNEAGTSIKSEDGAGSLSLPFVGLSVGGTRSSAEQLVKSLSESSGVTFQKKQDGTRYEPVKIDTFRLKDLNGNTDLVVSKEVYVTKDEQAAYFEDSPVRISKQTIYDVVEERYGAQVQKKEQAVRDRAAEEAARAAEETAKALRQAHEAELEQQKKEIKQAEEYNDSISKLTDLGHDGKPEDGYGVNDNHRVPPAGWHISHVWSEAHRCAIYVEWSDASGTSQSLVCLWARGDYKSRAKESFDEIAIDVAHGERLVEIDIHTGDSGGIESLHFITNGGKHIKSGGQGARCRPLKAPDGHEIVDIRVLGANGWLTDVGATARLIHNDLKATAHLASADLSP